jgi:formylglycine-generating enzyme required for sulfatase activity
LPPGFRLDDGVEIVSLRAADTLCLIYDAIGRADRALVIREYFPAGIATRGNDKVVAPHREEQRELYGAGLDSFIAACERLAAIEHKAVEPLVGLIEGYGTAYLVLDQPPGVALPYWLDALGRPVTVPEVEAIANGMCEGLSVAHAADLLHLDLSPETVFIHAGTQPVLVGFAAPAVAFATSAGRPPLAAKPGYASPEREAGDLAHLGPRSDIYSAAAILYRLLTGQAPANVAVRRAADPVPAALAKVGKAKPPGLLAAIEAGLALDPAARPATATEFHALMHGTSRPARPAALTSTAPAPAPKQPAPRPAEPARIQPPPEPAPAAKPPPAPTPRTTPSPKPRPGAAAAKRPVPKPPLSPVWLALGAVVFALAGMLAYSIIPEGTTITFNPPPDTTETAAVRPEPKPPVRTESPPPAKASTDPDTPLDRAAEARLKPGNTFRECSGCPQMVVIPAGSFSMGSPVTERGHETDEEPQHNVELKSSFAMSVAPVTRAEFELFVAASGYQSAKSCRVYENGGWVERTDLSYRNPGFRQDADHPVICVNWNDARAYADWLSTKTGKRYRLPTEAEWEYAARAGSTTPFWWGNQISTSLANYDGSLVYGSGNPGEHRQATVRAREFDANPWGLYQVHGNVSQWVEDCWNAGYRGAPADGSAWTQGDCARRVLRGGSWGYAPKDLRAAYREGATATFRTYTFGIRLVRVLDNGR